MAVIGLAAAVFAEERPQYESGNIRIPAASADEPRREDFSLPLAVEYLEKAAAAWNASRKCVACHTNGIYMVVRPALSAKLGPPPEDMRRHLVTELRTLAEMNREELQKSTRPAQVINAAAGLAEWDAHIARGLSAETRQAVALMFAIQLETGTWGSLDCWPPYESDAYHLATVAAMAAATAPGWLQNTEDATSQTAVDRLKNYLRNQSPPHDYGRVLLLWAATRMPDLLPAGKKQELVEMLWKQQRPDGGWSLRTFAAPEAWGCGNRDKKLREEPEFADPPSDGHQTGLAIIVLRESGVDARDPRLQRGVTWLLKNQRVSGRWWTRSLNTDNWHFITYSGTAFPLLALNLCDGF
jgi:squalene-hopene/tetraprenyl-beta-curcumene cyclase